MAFDPYDSWLGITAADRPPTYYDLLGLSAFESDPETIEKAALRRMSKVRQHQIGPHGDVSQEILAELARARLVLIDPDRRADYDARLRARSEGRPETPAVVEENAIVAAVTAASAPAPDGLDILAKIRCGNERPPDLAIATDNKVTGDLPRGAAGLFEGGLEGLASISTSGSDEPRSVRSTTKKRPVLWKNRLFVVAFLSTHVAVIGVFFTFGSAIALYVRSFIGATDPAARAVAEGPPSSEEWPGKTAPGPHSIDHNRPAPTTWIRFERGTSVTVAKSADFDMSEHDFTIFTRIKTERGGTVFSKAPSGGRPGAGRKRLLIRNGSPVFEFHGAPPIATVGRQVDDGLWHEVAVTYTRKDHQLGLFIDGNAHGPRTIAAPRDVSGHVIRIGSVASSPAANESQHFDGLISDVRFYQRALTKEEIADLASREPGGKLPLARWKLREADGRFVRDQSGHGHVGTREQATDSNDTVLASAKENAANPGSRKRAAGRCKRSSPRQ